MCMINVCVAFTFFSKLQNRENMSGFAGKKQVGRPKRKAERKQEKKSWPQVQAEHRWAQQMKAKLKDAERMFIIKRWVEQRKASQKPPAQRLAELKEAEKKQADEMQAEQRWEEWRQKHIAQWKLEQRREEEFNASKKKRDLQETRTRRTEVLESLTSWKELNMMDDLLEEVRLNASKRPAKQNCYPLVHNEVFWIYKWQNSLC